MKLYEHPDTEKTLDRLPEMPPGVEVPDDISGLVPPTTKRTSGGIRWMRWLAAIIILGAAGIVAAVLVSNGTETDEAPVDYMQMYGTDNPTFVDGSAGPGTITIVAPDSSYMDVYGTDNPVFVSELSGLPATDLARHPEAVVTDDYMTLYGTDNPTFVDESAGLGTITIVAPDSSYMDEYGTDNPVLVVPTIEGNLTQLPAGVSPEGTIWADLYQS
jgi:hypothetical protein